MMRNNIIRSFAVKCVLSLFLGVFLTTWGANAQQVGPIEGNCSYYGKKFHGRRTASGERYNMYDLTAAHRTLEFGTMVKVTNLSNGKTLDVRINDRGPFKASRILDVSREAAKELGMIEEGIAKIKMELVSESVPIIVTEADVSDPVAKKEVKANPEKQLEQSPNFDPGHTYSLWGTVRYPEGVGVQVSSFNDIHNAKVYVREMREAGFEEIYIESKGTVGAPLFRIIAGAFEEREKAADFQVQLRKAGFNGFIKTHGQN